MSKLALVREALKNNPDINVVHEGETRDEFWPKIFKFYVAPTIGLYTRLELQAQLESLVSTIMIPTWRDNIVETSDMLSFGRIFVDKGGQRARVASDGATVKLDPNRERIAILLFPDIHVAKDVVAGTRAWHAIKKDELLKYQCS